MTPDLPAAALSEPRAREIVLVQAFDQNLGPLWTAEDRAWASRLALETAGTAAAPAQFLAERARNALQRLAPRDAAVRRWLDKPAWRQRWIVAALAAGLLLGLALDSLGGSQRINLLAPPVWGTIAWNLLVYFSLLWGWLGPACPPLHVLRRTLGRWLWPTSAASGPLQQAQAAWRAHAAPLTAARAATLMHAAAAALALGLVAGLYLRGLVLDFRAGWQSTFLSAAAVQGVLASLLAPATALTGISVPDAVALEAMRITPAAPEASASAAPWIHLYATMLGLLVIAPRALLALLAAARAAWGAQHFALPLGTAYFQGLAARQQGTVAQVQVLPHAAAPPAQAVLGLRALLAPVLGDEVQLRVAAAVPYGEEEAAAPAIAGQASAALRIALFDMAATPEAESQGRLVQVLLGAQPAVPLLIVVDEAAWRRRFGGLPDRLAQRRALWQSFGAQHHAGVLCADLDQPEVAAHTAELQRLLAR